MEDDVLKRIKQKVLERLSGIVSPDEDLKKNEQSYKDMLHTNPEQLEEERRKMRQKMSEIPTVHVFPKKDY